MNSGAKTQKKNNYNLYHKKKKKDINKKREKDKVSWRIVKDEIERKKK